MVDMMDAPPRVMDLLRMFLAASSRGEEAVLILETRKRIMTTKFKSVEAVAGNPVPAATYTVPSKKVNPARARRSKLRLEQFVKKKLEEKEKEEASQCETLDQVLGCQASGNTRNSRLVLNLANKEEKAQESGLPSPILQLDGDNPLHGEFRLKYTFISQYGEEDILSTLDDLFTAEGVDSVVHTYTLLSRERMAPLSNKHQCIVELQIASDQIGQFSWPGMKKCDADVFQELSRIKS